MTFDKKNIRLILFVIFISTLFFWGLQHFKTVADSIMVFFGILTPFIMGGAIAFIINVPMRQIEKHLFNKKTKFQKLKRPVAYILTLLSVIAVLALALFVIIPEIVNTIETMSQQVPGTFNAVKKFIDNLVKSAPETAEIIKGLNLNFDELTKQAISILQNSASGLLNISVGLVSKIVGGTVNFIIGFIFSIYLLFQKEKLSRQAKQVLYALAPTNVADKTVYVMKMANSTFAKFISGQGLEALIIGGMFFIAMSLLRFPYALLVSVLIALTSLIPIIGAFIGCIIGALLILMINPFRALLFVMLFFVLQQIEGNLIYPHVVGGSIGLPSIWVLFAVTVGGGLFGVVGMLIFIPLCSIFYTLFTDLVFDRLKERKISPQKWET